MSTQKLAPTLIRALEEYQEGYMRARNLAERSRVEYSTSVSQFLEFLQKHKINKVERVSPNHIEAYLAELDRKGMASVTRRKKLIILRTFFGWLQGMGEIRSNPTRRVIPPYPDYPTPRFLSPKQCRRLLTVVRNSRDQAIIQLLLQTGITLSEVERLTVMDIAMPETISSDSEGTLRVVGRRGKTRIVPLNATACKALAAWLEVRPGVEDTALFLSAKGDPMTWRGIQYLVGRCLEKARIENASVHTLRHTFAVQRLAQGDSRKSLQQTLGLLDKRSTAPYTKLANRVEHPISDG